jgi:hypothetical protein
MQCLMQLYIVQALAAVKSTLKSCSCMLTHYCRLVPGGLKPSYILLNPKTEASPGRDNGSVKTEQPESSSASAGTGTCMVMWATV